MGINSIQSTKTTEATPSGVLETVLPKDNQARKAPQSPSLKSLKPRQSPKVKTGAETPPLQAHSDLRAKSRSMVQVNIEAVKEALGSHAAILERIHPQRLENFYKHASMMLNAPVSDKAFLVNCLACLYVTAPDASHPNAADPDWMDDQEVLWGDELMFMFECSSEIDNLDEAGKNYFANSLMSKEGVARQDVGLDTALSQTLSRAKQRL